MANTHLKEDFKNPWFLGILTLVTIALASTIWMAVIAGQNNPGMVNENYYQKGKEYFNTMPDKKNLDWRLQILIPEKPQLGMLQTYRFYALDHQGKALKNAKVTFFAYRPSDAKADFKLDMIPTQDGSFTTTTSFLLKGTWDLIVHVQHGEQVSDISQRIFIQD